MGYSIGYDRRWGRDIGYGVPATCDYPDCGGEIDRGISYVCGGEPYGGNHGCGLFFCEGHLWIGGEHDHPQMCEACVDGTPPFEPTPDVQEWTDFKMTDPSWDRWRKENGRDAHIDALEAEIEMLKRVCEDWYMKYEHLAMVNSGHIGVPPVNRGSVSE